MRGGRLVASASAVCAFATAAGAQTEPDDRGRLRLSATERVRYELIDGQARAGFNESDDVLNFRTTLLAEYETGPVKLAAELWDSRVYRADRGTPVSTNEVNALELVQAFAEVRLGDAAGPGPTATVQAGRFMINLGSRRLVAVDDYRNTTNGYTGLRVDLATEAGWRATVIYTLPRQRRPDDLDTLFGMRRADLAPAGLYNAIARTNLVSPGVRLEATPDRETDWFIGYRPMWLASRFDAFSSTGVRDASGRSGRFAGHQVDSRIRRRLSRALMLEADMVLLAKGRFLCDAPNAPPGRWTRYVSLNAVASF